MELCLKICSLLLLLLFCHCHGKDARDHPGHLQPFGVGLKTMSIETRTEFPDPIEFFDSYIARSKPVIFKGVAKSFPNYNNLRNDTYLGDVYGNWKIAYEPTTKEVRTKTILNMSFKKFTKLYSKNKFYMVSDIMKPNPIRHEISIPKPLLCGDLGGRMETCVMWFSAGGTRSLLHADSADNFNCLYDGVKEFYIAHPKHNSKFYYKDGSFSEVDMDKVDYHKYPKLLRVPWYYAKLEAGDCLYLPFTWVHHIKSHGPRNFAVNLFFDHLEVMPNRAKCEANLGNINNTEPLTSYKVLDKFERGRVQWLAFMAREKDHLTKERFCGILYLLNPKQNTPKECQMLASYIDTNKDGYLSFLELYNVDIRALKPFVEDMLAEDDGGNFILKYEEIDPELEKDEL